MKPIHCVNCGAHANSVSTWCCHKGILIWGEWLAAKRFCEAEARGPVAVAVLHPFQFNGKNAERIQWYVYDHMAGGVLYYHREEMAAY